MVRTNTVAGPGSDAAIVRVKETGTSIAMALDGNGRFCALDPRAGAKLIVAECCRNVSVSGALPIGATNNLNFGNPERPEIMAQLVAAIEGMAEACAFFEAPITGGNVSLYNETLGEPVFPSPVLGIVGLLKTAAPVPNRFPKAGLSVMLLGGAGECDLTRFGGTQYAKVILDTMWGLPPALDMDYEKRVQAAMREIAQAGHAAAAHDCADGGLAVALAEMSFGGTGAAVALKSDLRPEFLLFHEGPSRIVIAAEDPDAVAAIAAKHGVACPRIGETISGHVRLASPGGTLVDVPIPRLQDGWEHALERMLEGSFHV
jgi:phosphoribosylformylglycinamidine synthase